MPDESDFALAGTAGIPLALSPGGGGPMVSGGAFSLKVGMMTFDVLDGRVPDPDVGGLLTVNFKGLSSGATSGIASAAGPGAVRGAGDTLPNPT